MHIFNSARLALAFLAVVVTPLAAQGTSQALTPGLMPQNSQPTAETKCWTDWSEAAQIVRREALTPIERVNQLARDKHPGAEVIKVTLCEEHGKFVYRLLLRERRGQVKSELLDAR
jgi:uncharacterized membrane protein YkoI